MFKMVDSSDRESVTLTFVTVAFFIVTSKFLLAGYDLTWLGLGVTTPISITEYATAFAAILAVWLGREWVKRPGA